MSRIKNFVKTVRNEFWNYRVARSSPYESRLSKSDQKILESIQQNGYCVLEGFLSQEWCDMVRNEIDQLILKRADEVWVDDKKSDHRVYGAERVSDHISAFYNDSKLTEIINSYLKKVNRAGFTLAARLEAKEDNLGSGGGWHRDIASKKQIKAITYLSDVEEDNGPFQYLGGSHSSIDVIKKQFKYDLDYRQNRFRDDEIEQMVNNSPERLITFTASKGTVLLVDTRGIHRGMPISAGSRYALTNYYLEEEIPSHIAKLLIKSK